MKVLLAVDGSIQSDAAVDEVAVRTWPRESTIRVVSVVETLPFSFFGLPAAYLQDLVRPIESHAQTAVDAATQKLVKTFGASVDVFGDVLKGSPKRVIVEEADRWGADLIVVGSHGHGALEGFLLGSVSQSVALHAHCSVEIVRSRTVGASES